MRLIAVAVLVGSEAAADEAAIAGLDRCLAAVEDTHAPALMETMSCPGDEDACFQIAASQADTNCLAFATDMCGYLTNAPAACLSALADHARDRAAVLRSRLPAPQDVSRELGPFERMRVTRQLERFDAGDGGLSSPCAPPPQVLAEPFCAYLNASLVLQGIRSSARTLGIPMEPR